MNTIKIPAKKQALMIAHRGVSGIERENTAAAFIAAGNRSYFGIETDVHVTSDGKFIVIHDDKTGRVAERDVEVEKTTFDELRALRVKDTDGTMNRSDLILASLDEYVSICKRYGKISVLELKNPMSRESVYGIYDAVNAIGHTDDTIFIAFDQNNLIYIREKNETQRVQYLRYEADDACLDMLKEKKMDIDIHFKAANKEFVNKCHSRGIKVNVWTVDTVEAAEKLIDDGVDFITTNILE